MDIYGQINKAPREEEKSFVENENTDLLQRRPPLPSGGFLFSFESSECCARVEQKEAMHICPVSVYRAAQILVCNLIVTGRDTDTVPLGIAWKVLLIYQH